MLFVVEEKGRNLDFGGIFQQLGELTVGFSAVVTRVNAADIVKVFLSGFIEVGQCHADLNPVGFAGCVIHDVTVSTLFYLLLLAEIIFRIESNGTILELSLFKFRILS